TGGSFTVYPCRNHNWQARPPLLDTGRAATTDPTLAILKFDGEDSRYWINGDTGTFASDPITATGALNVGAQTVNLTAPMSGELARILMFDHAVTDQELVNIEIGIAQEHGVGVVTHATDGVPNNNDLPAGRVLHL